MDLGDFRWVEDCSFVSRRLNAMRYLRVFSIQRCNTPEINATVGEI